MEVAKSLCKCGLAFLKYAKFKEHIYQHKDGTGLHTPIRYRAEKVVKELDNDND